MGREIGKLGIPVFLYGEAARRGGPARTRRRPARRSRRSGEEASGAGGEPDFGPGRLHPTAGGTAVGARDFLVAYNVILATDNAKIARAIARRIRESAGGLPAVKSLGFFLESRGLAQVSMNLVDYRRTSSNKPSRGSARKRRPSAWRSRAARSSVWHPGGPSRAARSPTCAWRHRSKN